VHGATEGQIPIMFSNRRPHESIRTRESDAHVI
jgi:hypothetical protein